MSILLIFASPQPHGALAKLCAHFTAGAQASGQTVEHFDVGSQPIPPLQTDATGALAAPPARLTALQAKIAAAQTVVLATPIYLFEMDAQLKAVIDQLAARTPQLPDQKTGILLATSPEREFTYLKSEIKACFDHFGWRFGGQMLAAQVPDTPSADLRFYPAVATALGQSCH